MITLLVVLLAFTLSVQAHPPVHTGTSVNSRSDDGHGNYAFNYDIVDPLGAKNGRYEEGDAHGNKRGFYHLTDIDGRSRRVDYVADEYGFRAFVQTNEPGTATSEPAGAIIKSDQDTNIHPAPPTIVSAPPSPVVVSPPFVVPPSTVHEVYTPPIIPEPRPQFVSLSRPYTPRQVSHTVLHDSPTYHSTILPVSRPPISLSHSSHLLGPATTTTRIVPATEHAGPIFSHTNLIAASPDVYSVPRLLSHANGISSGPTYVSLPTVSRSHHGYLPIR